MIPSIITRKLLQEAIGRISREGIPPRRVARDYCLVHEGRHYPPKYIIAFAHQIATGQLLSSNQFSGGQESNSFLRSRGFEIAECSCGGTASPMRPRPNLAQPVPKTPLTPQTHHSQRCPECKTRIRQLLERIYGECLQDYRLSWPAQLSAYVGTPAFAALQQVLSALEGFRGFQDFIRSETVAACDFYVPTPGFIVEFDESQHFTGPRKLALTLYPTDLPIGFPKERWISLCDRHNVRDNDPPYRDEQRAWYDTLRDLVPSLRGLGPTVRLYAGEMAWCSLDPDSDMDLVAFRNLLGRERTDHAPRRARNVHPINTLPERPTVPQRSAAGDGGILNQRAVSVYTVTLQQDGNGHTDAERLRLLDEILACISQNDSMPVILLPGGYFGSGRESDENVQRNLATVESYVQGMLKKLESTARICLGIDGRKAKDQLAVAVSRDGIEALGRKWHPTDYERGRIEPASDHLSPERGHERTFKFLGKRWYMAVCYDVFGISQRKLPNPGVDVVLVMAHQFWPRGKGDSGDNYFARLGFAGASKQWGCPVFGTGVFFGGKQVGEWPTGVLWSSGTKLPIQCGYQDIRLRPLREFRLSTTLIRQFALP